MNLFAPLRKFLQRFTKPRIPAGLIAKAISYGYRFRGSYIPEIPKPEDRLIHLRADNYAHNFKN